MRKLLEYLTWLHALPVTLIGLVTLGIARIIGVKSAVIFFVAGSLYIIVIYFAGSENFWVNCLTVSCALSLMGFIIYKGLKELEKIETSETEKK